MEHACGLELTDAGGCTLLQQPPRLGLKGRFAPSAGWRLCSCLSQAASFRPEGLCQGASADRLSHRSHDDGAAGEDGFSTDLFLII